MPAWQKTLIAVSIPTVIVLGGLFPGWTQSVYEWLWTNTAGEPYTYIMRRNPILLFLPSLAVLAVFAWCLPRRYWARVLLIWATYGMGLLAGHVVWGEGTIHLPI